MPKQCPCEIALLEHIPVKCLVWLVTGYYHKDDSWIVDMLTRDGSHPDALEVHADLPHGEMYVKSSDPYDIPDRVMNSSHLTVQESRSPMSDRYISGYVKNTQHQPVVYDWYGHDNEYYLRADFAGRLIFEVAEDGSEYIYTPARVSGKPCSGQISQIIVTVIAGAIVVEIDKIGIKLDPRGEFGSFLETPFARSQRAKLRRQMYNLQYLGSEDPQHMLFNKVCDLAHKTIWEMIH